MILELQLELGVNHMLIKQNAACEFYCGAVTLPTGYFIFKEGTAGPVAGTGTVTAWATSGILQIVSVQLAAGETDTLGGLDILLQDATPDFTLVVNHQVVKDLPGESVSDVTGDIAGDILGDLLGSLTPGERIAIANTSFDLPDAVELGLTQRNFMRVVFAVLAGQAYYQPGQAQFWGFGAVKIRCTVQVNPLTGRPLVTYDFS